MATKKNPSEEEAKKEAVESLKKDFGEEGFKVLMEGADAIVDVTEKTGMPYKDFRDKVEDSYKKGLVREKDGMIMGFEKKEKEDEES